MRAELVAYARLQIVVTSLIGCNIHCNTVVVFSSWNDAERSLNHHYQK